MRNRKRRESRILPRWGIFSQLDIQKRGRYLCVILQASTTRPSTNDFTQLMCDIILHCRTNEHSGETNPAQNFHTQTSRCVFWPLNFQPMPPPPLPTPKSLLYLYLAFLSRSDTATACFREAL